MKKLIFLFFALLVVSDSIGQSSAVLYNMQQNPARNKMNPAFFSMQKSFIGMPILSGISFTFSNSGFSYQDIIRKDYDDSLYVDMDNAIAKMKGNNLIHFSSQFDLLNAGLIIGKKFFVGLSAAERIQLNFIYNKDLFNFAYYGNEAYLGKEANIEIKLDATHYREYALTFATELNDKFSVGTRVKYLYGMENISTKTTAIKLYTDPNTFGITASGNIGINTSGLSYFSGDNEFNFNQYAFGKSNSGIAFDFGLQAKPVRNLVLSAAINDVGSINWKDDVVNYNAAHVNNEFSFSGIDINQLLGEDDIEEALSDYADSLANQFFLDTTYFSYTTSLPFTFSAGAQYFFKKKVSTGLLYQAYSYRDYLSSSVSANISIQVGKSLNTNFVYTLMNGDQSNIGFGMGITFLQMHWYIVSDNVLAFLTPTEVNSTSIRTGMLMTFGK